MLNVFYIIGEVLLIASLVGLIGVCVWVVMSALHVKNKTVGHAKRISQRPIAAGKNLATTVKGIVQQETVRIKRIGATVTDAAGAVQHSAEEIKEAAQTVHAEDLKPALATLRETQSRAQEVTKVVRLAAQLTQAAAKQRPR